MGNCCLDEAKTNNVPWRYAKVPRWEKSLIPSSRLKNTWTLVWCVQIQMLQYALELCAYEFLRIWFKTGLENLCVAWYGIIKVLEIAYQWILSMRQNNQLMHALTVNSVRSKRRKIVNLEKESNFNGRNRTITDTESERRSIGRRLNETTSKEKQEGLSYLSWWKLLISTVWDPNKLIKNVLILGISNENWIFSDAEID